MDNTIYIQDREMFYQEAFKRNIGLLTPEEQNKLRHSKVAIVGMGGVGGVHLVNLVRLGVGEFHIADMEYFEVPNIQRQCGAFMDTLGKNKAETMVKIALSINPHLKIRVFPEGVNSQNIEDFLSDADIFLDGLDFFSIEERRLVFGKARGKGIYAVTAGPLGFGCALLIFSPEGMGFDEYFDLNDSMSYLEKIIAFGVGLAPAALHLNYLKLDSVNLDSKQGPSIISACALASSLAVTETMNILLKRRKPQSVPYYFQFDPYTQRLKKGYLLWGNRNPIQRLKRWYFLKKFTPLEKTTDEIGGGENIDIDGGLMPPSVGNR